MLSHICVIRADLSPGLRAAYLIHAAGESSPGNLPEGTRAVALAARDESHLRSVAASLGNAEVAHTAVWEDGELFAVGVEPLEDLSAVRRVTSGLPLAR